MGKYISAGNRTTAPIYPKMPNVNQRTQPSAAPKTEPKIPKEKAPQTVVVNEKINIEKAKPAASSKSKRFTPENVRQGFEMSVILGEPVARKHQYGRKISK